MIQNQDVMNDDSALLIMKAIGDAKAELKEDIGRVHTELTKDIGKATFSLGAFQGNVEARLAATEDSLKTQKKQQFVVSYVVIPFLTVTHAIAAHFGIKV